ncbi:MAG: alpha-E domain-containing protein [Sulfuritalea sp.]|nr:alpha-E domain-containing protein [Sulfuritalea sp.]
MLSSTADHLYWMARSMERAENTARMLDVTYRLALLRHDEAKPFQEWTAMLTISGLYEKYVERHGLVSAENVLHFMSLDEGNPSSIHTSLYNARENARAVRGTISQEMWETINHTWLEMRDTTRAMLSGDKVSAFFEWVKDRSHMSRGVTHGTMLRDDGFRFLRLGTFLERGDNTARLLDVKYHILLPSLAEVGGAADYYQWSAVLRSLSALSSYRKVYRDLITPRRVAELLILRRDVPRSLAACASEVNRLAQELGGPRSRELIRRTGLLDAELRYGIIDDIMVAGLHEYLTAYLERVYGIADQVNRTYFWAVDAPLAADPALA